MELSKEEKEAIETVKGITTDDLLNYWEGPEEPYEAIQIVLNLISKLQEKIESQKITLELYCKNYGMHKDKLEKQSKVIDEMAHSLYIADAFSEYGNSTEEIKQYFYGKVERKWEK